MFGEGWERREQVIIFVVLHLFVVESEAIGAVKMLKYFATGCYWLTIYNVSALFHGLLLGGSSVQVVLHRSRPNFARSICFLISLQPIVCFSVLLLAGIVSCW